MHGDLGDRQRRRQASKKAAVTEAVSRPVNALVGRRRRKLAA
jgi:hypothetical protein